MIGRWWDPVSPFSALGSEGAQLGVLGGESWWGQAGAVQGKALFSGRLGVSQPARPQVRVSAKVPALAGGGVGAGVETFQGRWF